MKPKEYAVLTEAVESGVNRGIRRAYKHTDNPTQSQLELEVYQAVMSALNEWFDFDEVKE